jgi:probable addiction module antidote protein
MKKKNINEFECKIEKDDFRTMYAKILSKDAKKLKSFKKHIADEYNKTKDTALFLHNLKILAMAEGKVVELAKNAGVNRTSVYRMLSREANPSFDSIMSFTSVLGVPFVSYATK